MKRFTYSVLKEVEVLAENEPNALCAVVLEDYDNEKVMAINFQYEQVEVNDDDFVGIGDETGVTSFEHDGFATADEAKAAPSSGAAYDAGFDDGFKEGVSEGEVSERSRIHEALESAQRD